MLSLVICSRQEEISERLENNISETIGVPYELIVINNAAKDLSIFQAYNKGLRLSKSEIIIFLHDDLLFNTVNWGTELKNIFKEDPKIGLIGIAGGTLKTRMPSTWWFDREGITIRIIQHQKNNEKIFDKNSGFGKKGLKEVVAIDGVLMAMRKDSRILFSQNLSGFHCYDLDISLKHHYYGKKVVVTDRIVIKHFSGGSIDKDWYISTSKIHKIYRAQLPVIKRDIVRNELRIREFIAGAGYVTGLLQYNLKKEALYWWIQLIKLKPYSKFHVYFLVKFSRTFF